MAKFNMDDYVNFLTEEEKLYLDAIDPFSDNPIKLIVQESAESIEVERIRRKAISRNRHLNEIKAKKRAKKSADILEKRYSTFIARTSYEEFRLYSRKSAASKKAARIKVS